MIIAGTLVAMAASVTPAAANTPLHHAPRPVPGIDLLPGDRPSWTSGLNDRGEVIGFHSVRGQIHGFVWHDGALTDIAPPEGGDYSATSSINRWGEVAGFRGSRGGPVPMRAYVWHDGVVTDLESLGGNTLAEIINDHGLISGTDHLAGVSRAVLWDHGKATLLPGLGGSYSAVMALNERGQAAGYSELPGDDSHAVLWTGGQIVDLGPGRAVGLNDRGQVLVEQSPIGQLTTAFLWENGRKVVFADRVLSATGLTERGQVTGTYLPPGAGGIAEAHGFLWDHGRFTDLGAVSPTGLNERGQVLAETMVNGLRQGLVIDHGRTYTLTPVAGPDSATTAINDHGLVAGWSQANNAAVLWRLPHP
jgi:probable HAF family extracellular repeat protein